MWFNRKPSAPAPIAATMRAVSYVESARGAVAPLEYITTDVPSIGEEDILIKVHYVGVNRADLLQRSGLYRAPEGDSPIMGLEVSGTIEAVGSRVIGWSIGEPVAALTGGGAYAEYVRVPATQVLALPARINLAEAATLPEACATAYMALVQEAKLERGERVLIHGGASGIGLVLIQIARALGAEVFSTASTPEKQAFIHGLGATPLAYDALDFANSARAAMQGKGVDVIIDTLGGAYFTHHLSLLNANGRMVTLACLEGADASISLGRVLMKHLHIAGATLRNRSALEKAGIMEGVRKHFWPLIAAGRVIPYVDSVFPLSDAANAHARMENRLNCGKIVLEVTATESAAVHETAANDNQTLG